MIVDDENLIVLFWERVVDQLSLDSEEREK